MFTEEQLSVMEPKNLVTNVLELQKQLELLTPDPSQIGATILTPEQNDLLVVKQKITELKQAGEQLFENEITMLETKAKAMEEKINSNMQEVEKEIGTFWENNCSSIVHGVEIALLISILMKLIK